VLPGHKVAAQLEAAANGYGYRQNYRADSSGYRVVRKDALPSLEHVQNTGSSSNVNEWY
jgi:hypothetical protein